jgi:hypothetical protein
MKDILVRYLLGPLACVLWVIQRAWTWLVSSDTKSLSSLPNDPVQRLIGRWGWYMQLDGQGTGIHFYKYGAAKCGNGCHCLTQCGDYYESHGLSKPNGKK